MILIGLLLSIGHQLDLFNQPLVFSFIFIESLVDQFDLGLFIDQYLLEIVLVCWLTVLGRTLVLEELVEHLTIL